jgi:hypothetical protein
MNLNSSRGEMANVIKRSIFTAPAQPVFRVGQQGARGAEKLREIRRFENR